MALMSDAILVGDSTPFTCCFANFRKSVNVTIVFYTTAEARSGDELTPQAGSRSVTATNAKSGYAGSAYKPSSFQRDVEVGIFNGTLTLNGGVEDELLLGSGMGNVKLVAAPDVNPPGALSYRFFVEASGSSTTG